MDTGYYISGIGHGVLIGWALIGGLFTSTPDDNFEVASVSIITADEFEALSTPKPVSDAPDTTPAAREEPAAETPPEEPPAEPTPPEDTAPDVTEITPPPVSEPEDTPPETPQPPAEDNPVVIAPPAPQATPRPSERVTPDPVAPPPPDTDVADEVHPDNAPAPDAQTPPDPEPPAAPEESSDRIIPETLAPARSVRPSARPKRPTRPVETATTEQPATNNNNSSSIDDTLRELQAEEAAAATSSAPTGPPLSRGEKDGLRVAVSKCWTVDVGGASSRVTVVVGVSLEKSGKVITSSMRLISSEGGDDKSVAVAFRNARSAIIRCQNGGYKLPIEKYSHWRDIEMTFNPDKMRIK